MLGIISGTIAVENNLMHNPALKYVKTKYGAAQTLNDDKFALIQRHGLDHDVPPHRINYKANMMAFKKLGVEYVVGVGSVGSLKTELKPPAIVIPHDYVSFSTIETYFDSEVRHITPSFDENLRQLIISAAKKSKIKVAAKAVYAQTHGPRLETKAEINLLKDYADVVGMTHASEATLAQELGLKYASVCSVGNYAHGIGNCVPDFQTILEHSKENRGRIVKILNALGDVV